MPLSIIKEREKQTIIFLSFFLRCSLITYIKENIATQQTRTLFPSSDSNPTHLIIHPWPEHPSLPLRPPRRKNLKELVNGSNQLRISIQLATKKPVEKSERLGGRKVKKLTVDGVLRLCSRNSTKPSKVRAPVKGITSNRKEEKQMASQLLMRNRAMQ